MLEPDGRVHDGDGPRLTFSGIGVYHPGLFAGLARGTAARMAPCCACAMARNAVAARATRRWTDVGTPERLAELDAELGGKSC